MMKPFARNTIYRCRILRYLKYRNGHGVHSTYAFRLITEVIRDRYAYYDDTVIRAHLAHLTPQMLRLCRLYYRLIARLHPSAIRHHLSEELSPHFVYCGAKAAPRSDQRPLEEGESLGEQTLLLTDQIRVAERWRSTAGEESYCLLLAPRTTPARSEAVLRLIEAVERGIIIDLYEAILLIKRNRHTYIYRGSL